MFAIKTTGLFRKGQQSEFLFKICECAGASGYWMGKHRRQQKSITVTKNNLKRFVDAQESSYSDALAEIKNGRKQSHWMWYIFPQIRGLGHSETSKYYAIQDLNEAELFLTHPVLGKRLIEISEVLLGLEGKTANQIFGSPDDTKLRSCMTLFSSLPGTHPVFEAVLDRYFNGAKDNKTLYIISETSKNQGQL
jgi:uncharacterized protein (DUF1810 family)